MRLLTLTQLKEGRENLASLVEEFYLFFLTSKTAIILALVLRFFALLRKSSFALMHLQYIRRLYNVHVSSIVDTAFMYGVLIIFIKQVQVKSRQRRTA